MVPNKILEAQAFWSHEHELADKDSISQIAAQFSAIPPIHDHEGSLTLTTSYLSINGDTELIIQLAHIDQLYLGFDDVYRRNFIKNLGLTCQPLRITYTNGLKAEVVYIIAGYNFIGCAMTEQLFNQIHDLLS